MAQLIDYPSKLKEVHCRVRLEDSSRFWLNLLVSLVILFLGCDSEKTVVRIRDNLIPVFIIDPVPKLLEAQVHILVRITEHWSIVYEEHFHWLFIAEVEDENLIRCRYL